MKAFWKKEYLVSLVFFCLCLLCFRYAGISFAFLADQVLIRFVRNGIMVLALIIPITAGMGVNFAVTVGAMAAQGAYIFALNSNMRGSSGLLFVLLLSMSTAAILGVIIGLAMNRVRGKEMITTIVIGFLMNYIYQFIFMVGFGTFIPVHNPAIVLAKGISVNNMLDLAAFKNGLSQIGLITVGGVRLPLLMILTILACGGLIYYFLHTRTGQSLRATGLDGDKAESIGIDVNRMRLLAMVLSTVLAAVGQFIFVQNMGMLNVYTGHLNTDVFSCAALMAGGATIKEARLRNAFLGIFLLHTLFILSPMAGQNVFNNVSLGEYFRSFIAYGTIAFALIMNLKYAGAK